MTRPGKWLLTLAILLPATAAQEVLEIPTVRVLVSDERQDLELSCKGLLELRAPERTKPLGRIPVLPVTTLTLRDRVFLLLGKRWELPWLTLVAREEPLRIGPQRYPQQLHLVREGDAFLVVNEVDIETYVTSVTRSEIGANSPLEAQKAQAIAARSYAASGIEGFPRPRRRRAIWDVYDDTRSQVYRGLPEKNPQLERAIRDTSSLVLTYRGRIVRAFYSAACGGTTIGYAEWQGKTQIPPLGGVTCGFCDQGPGVRWERTIPLDTLSRDLAKETQGLRIRAVEVSERTASQRPAELRLQGKATSVHLKASTFRSTLDLPTSMFAVRTEGDVLVLEGAGKGHGVGLCQIGALEMARKGWTAERILAHYYPEATVEPGYRLRGDRSGG